MTTSTPTHVGDVERPPAQRPEPGAEFVEVERFGQIVVGAGVQSVDTVVHGAQRRQHQHRGADRAGPQPAQQIQTVEDRQPPVDDQHVVVPGEPEVQAPVPVGRDVHRVPVVTQHLGEHGDQLPVVLDEQ